MPELAEVEYYRKQWDPGLGQEVRRVLVHSSARVYRETPAAAIRRALEGRRLLGSETHGKRMLFEFSAAAWLGLHLGIGDDWNRPPDSWLFNHRWKDGHHCPRCGSELSRDDLRGRTTCWCPRCQGP
ncbi:MAG: DNA-formamidopyrimidine glycosylase family protein [Verrucomicrobiales bacterium]